jgi:hypothetical protein
VSTARQGKTVPLCDLTNGLLRPIREGSSVEKVIETQRGCDVLKVTQLLSGKARIRKPWPPFRAWDAFSLFRSWGVARGPG